MSNIGRFIDFMWVEMGGDGIPRTRARLHDWWFIGAGRDDHGRRWHDYTCPVLFQLALYRERLKGNCAYWRAYPTKWGIEENPTGPTPIVNDRSTVSLNGCPRWLIYLEYFCWNPRQCALSAKRQVQSFTQFLKSKVAKP